MFLRLAHILWESVGRKLVLLPIAATGLLYWFELFGLGPETIPLAWLIYSVPIFSWLIVGLVAQNISLQEKVDLDPTPNMSLRDAFQHTMLMSRFAIGTDPDDEDFYANIESEIRDKARLGQLAVWARPIQEMSGGFRQTLAAVSPEKWDQYRIDLPSCIYASGTQCANN